MGKKDAEESSSHKGLTDVIGIILVTVAFVLFVALFSSDRGDLPYNKVPPNVPVRNWIGPVGAQLAYWSFLMFGAGGYLVPLFLLGFGLAQVVNALNYLKKCAIWAVVFIVSWCALLSLYTDWFRTLSFNMDSGSAGGMVGQVLNDFFFNRFFGRVGATAILGAIYLISLYSLTNHQLGDWVRAFFRRQPGEEEDEKVLEKRTKELEKEARELQTQLEKAKLAEEKKEKAAAAKAAKEAADAEPEEEAVVVIKGADLAPVPEPKVIDTSIPVVRASMKAPAVPEPVITDTNAPWEDAKPVATPAPAPAGPRKVGAATAADILGRGPGAKAEPVEASGDSTKKEEEVVELAAVTPEQKAVVPVPAPVAPPRPPMPRPPAKRNKNLSVAMTPMIGNYRLPGYDLLNLPDPGIKPTESKEELMASAKLMQHTLAQFGIEVSLGDITKGPTITRYELHPAPGVKLEKIQALTNNLAAALKAERINVLTPVPGKSSVGIEVPNLIKTKVIMRDLFESEEWQNTKARIPLALGKDVYGQTIIADLGEMPHLLIAGSTGSGKSVCINSIVASLLFKFSPDQLRFVMIDPKVVELQQYNALPHLVVPVVTDPKKVVLALRWVVNEMEKRYQIFAKVGVRNIKSFNERPKDKPVPVSEPELPLTSKKEKIEPGADGFAVELDEEIVVPRDDEMVIPEKLSYVVVIIDELADLMLVAPADVEMAIARITQMARAAGIHCIVATQRPSVDVITGVIKANIPARIAFQVASMVDSRTILDAMGADKLLGKGDMLYLPPGSAKLIRAQGVLITDQELQRVVDSIALQGKPSYEMEIHNQLQKPVRDFDGGDGGSDEDEDLIQQCIEVIRSEQKASVSLMQRRLRLGYTRAARIMDELENRGIVGPSKGAEPRDILMDLDAEENRPLGGSNDM